MESKLVSLFVLGLVSSALANPTPASGAPGTVTTPTTAGPLGNGTTTSAIPPGVDCLDNSQKDVICNLPKPAALCDAVGPADASCQQIASSVNGTSPACVSKGVCSFKLAHGNPSNGTTTTVSSSGSTTSGTTSTTTSGPTETTTTGTTSAATGTTPTYYAEPNTGYVSCAANQPGYLNIKSCSSNGLNIVYPSGGPSTGSTTPSTGSTTTSTKAPAPGK